MTSQKTFPDQLFLKMLFDLSILSLYVYAVSKIGEFATVITLLKSCCHALSNFNLLA